MPIEFACPGCGKQLRLADEHAGKTGRCPACQTTFAIPASGTASSQASSPFTGSPQPTDPFSRQTQEGQQPTDPARGNWPASSFSEQAPAAPTSYHPYGPPTQYTAASANKEGYAVASTVLGVISIVAAPGVFLPCCCLVSLISIPSGILGIILAFQAPPERRNLGLVLNAVGIGLSVVLFLLWIVIFVLAR
jgi:hypothetical protein